MLVDPGEIDDPRVQGIDESTTIGIVHSDDRFSVIAQIQRLASGLGMNAHDRLLDRGHRFLLRLGHRLLAMMAIA